MPKPTILDVAAAAGVSRGTVSRVLNDSPRVSPRAKQAVEAAIKQTGYRRNPHAASLASGRNNAIAVLLTQPQQELFDDPTFSRLLQGVSNGLSGTDIALVLLLAGTEEERRRTSRFLDSGHIDGVVHLSPHLADPMMDALIGADIPVVLCGKLPEGVSDPKLWSITVTDRQGAADAVSHLLERGSTRIGMIAGPADAPGSIERLSGFQEALGERYDPSLVVHGDYAAESGRTGLAALLDARPDIDAVFCASDRMAAGAYETALSRGLRIPEDLRVVGFDGHALGTRLRPALTTIAQPIQEYGRAAVEMLLDATQGRLPGHRIFPTELVIRASS